MAPPLHMPIVYGSVTSKKLATGVQLENMHEAHSNELCYGCYTVIEKEDLMICVNPKCEVKCHVTCFSKYFFCDSNDIVPVEGNCPSCDVHLLWGDLVRKKKGCYRNLENDYYEID